MFYGSNFNKTGLRNNETRGYSYKFCTFLLFLRNKLYNVLNYYLYLPCQKAANSAIFIYNIRLQRSRENNSVLYNTSRNVEV
ncbi:hypothetical protein DXB27_00465 [Parabacteroides gordonii]|nr:hypothetical protein DXB27_00465 [Parabacteroides gordonii]